MPLPEQNRSLWDRDMIREGHGLVRDCLYANQPGPYQLQAAIQAVHCDAENDATTDWAQILALYDMLLPFTPTKAVKQARIVALAHVEGAETVLAQLDVEPDDRYGLAVRADLLARLGETARAERLFRSAAELAPNEAERAFLLRRASELDRSK